MHDPSAHRSSSPFLAKILLVAALVPALACDDDTPSSPDGLAPQTPTVSPEQPTPAVPKPLVDPVDIWENGKVTGQVERAEAHRQGYLLLDLGDDWTPYLFTEQGPGDPEPKPNAYRKTYLALAQERFPDDHHGRRAEVDKYLELYGIPPTLSVLKRRFKKVQELTCVETLNYAPLEVFDGHVGYQSNAVGRKHASRYDVTESQINRLLNQKKLTSVEELDEASLSPKDTMRLRDYRRFGPQTRAIRAAQKRLKCTGYFKGKGKYKRGAMDWATHEAVAEFERRNRVYGWGVIGGDTLQALRVSPLENERLSILRILTERAVLAAGVVEDGSTSMFRDKARTYKGADGQDHPIRNMVDEIQETLVAALGIETTEHTQAFLDQWPELSGHRWIAIRAPSLPEYYNGDMDLHVRIDRGDVWYEFPYDGEGRERNQPVERRPHFTILTRYRGKSIPLARFGTTIGGWRKEFVDGRVMWKYKNSPTGDRVWSQVVASPVWLPPEGTPPRGLLSRRVGEKGKYSINYHEMGPSYASAYGLVAAYHKKYSRRSDGTYKFWGDEGIRSHGSVDYMSIMRRHSHGCHRLHNHIAVRLMTFVLNHRPHVREGQQQLAFERFFEYDGEQYHFKLTNGGYIFSLTKPVEVTVTEGRIRGRQPTPITHPIPQYDEERGAYFLPDGGAVEVHRTGTFTPVPWAPDGGFPDGGVPPAPPPPTRGLSATPPPPPGSGDAAVPKPAPKPTSPASAPAISARPTPARPATPPPVRPTPTTAPRPSP